MTTRKSNADTDRFMEELLGGPMTFGMMVEALRTSAGLTQVALAKKLKISKANLCDIEKGRRFVSIERAVNLAKALGQPADFFVQIALQTQLNEAGLRMKVELKPVD